MAKATAGVEERLVIKAPNMHTVAIRITGKTPYMQHRFSKKAEFQERQEQGSTARSKKVRVARDFEKDYEEAKHQSAEGWCGIPAPAIRAACISACRLVGFQMTKAKLSVFVEADGECAKDGTPLIRLEGTPEQSIMPARNADGSVDLRARPMWRKWSADVRITYDGDQFTTIDVVNLLMRAGLQVGIGEGRPDSKKSAGMGFGTFTVEMAA